MDSLLGQPHHGGIRDEEEIAPQAIGAQTEAIRITPWRRPKSAGEASSSRWDMCRDLARARPETGALPPECSKRARRSAREASGRTRDAYPRSASESSEAPTPCRGASPQCRDHREPPCGRKETRSDG